jgi:hypothetical protein
MSDKELLRLAAKAAEIEVPEKNNAWFWLDDKGLHRDISGAGDGTRISVWNPLQNDGDALRLAVKLGLPISFPLYRKPDPSTVCVGRYWHASDSLWYPYEEVLGNDEYAAVRRAIVRAAAGIGSGRGM